MGLNFKRYAEGLRTIRSNFFLRRHTPLPSTIKLLQDIYPNVNWKRVHFYEGLPWFTPMVAPYVTCQALPRFYSFGGYSIYIKKMDESRAQCLADIIHEGFHVVQALQFARGYGLGFFRVWMLYYIAVFLKHGYRQNPFEVPAYNQEFRFLSYCARIGVRGIITKVDAGTFANISNEKDLVFPTFDYKFAENFWYLCLSFIICTIVTVIKMPVDILVYLLGSLVYRKTSKS